MKKKLAPVAVLVIFCGFLAGINVSFHSPVSTGRKGRIPASAAMMGKHQRLFDIEIESPQGIPDNPKKEVILRAKVTLLRELGTEVHYRWVLPEDVQKVDGQIEDSVLDLKASKSFVREITVDGLDNQNEPQVIVLQVYSMVDGVNLGSAGVFSTQPLQTQQAQGIQAQSAPHAKNRPELPRTIHQ